MSFSITIRLMYVSINSEIVLISSLFSRLSSLTSLKTQRKCNDRSEGVDRPSFLMKRTALDTIVTLKMRGNGCQNSQALRRLI